MLFVAVVVSTSYYLTGQLWDFQRYIMYLSMCMLTALTAEGLGLYLGTFKNVVVSIPLWSFQVSAVVAKQISLRGKIF